MAVPETVIPACEGPSLKTPSLPSPKSSSLPVMPPRATAGVITWERGSHMPVLDPSRYWTEDRSRLKVSANPDEGHPHAPSPRMIKDRAKDREKPPRS